MIPPLANPSQSSVLIIDQYQEDMHRLSRLLQERGYYVETVSTGQQGLKTAETNQPDLILLDTTLPDLNGYEVCQQLQANSHTQEIPVIFLSTLDQVWDKVKAFATGGRDYITKPFHDAEVLARIENQLSICNALKLLTMQNTLLAEEIKERQRVEKALRFSEEKFAKAFRANPSPITITRLSDGYHLDVNASFCQVTGYTPEEVIGRTAHELNLWVDSEKRQQMFKMVTMYGGVRNYEFQFRTKTGAIRTALLSVELINLHGEECLLSLSNDISKRVQAEQALQAANEELRRLAMLDGLTKVANRRRFNEKLNQEWLKLQRENAPLCLILSDVDYFKRFNDYYGHLAGDGCLQRVATAIADTVADYRHLVARYGGEEFAVILSHVDTEKALLIAEQIRQTVEQLYIPHEKSPVSAYVTLSLGVMVTYPTSEFPPESLIGVADLALYAAKKQGRNCTIIEVL
ncbi:MAG: diguanylate cyclase [Kamptonema sp. SIO4C4]|nr:diguanylate cyclase [Kamptonema sp. SIO4C4]